MRAMRASISNRISIIEMERVALIETDPPFDWSGWSCAHCVSGYTLMVKGIYEYLNGACPFLPIYT